MISAKYTSGRTIVVIVLLLLSGCASTRFGSQKEDVMMVTRRYVGDFMESRNSDHYSYFAPDVIWIKTTMDGHYGKIGVYSKAFNPVKYTEGDRLYVRRINYTHPGSEYEVVVLESSDENISYTVYGTNKNPDRKKAIDALFVPVIQETEDE